MTEKTYRLHGLVVQSDVPLEAQSVPAGAELDVVIRRGPDREIPADRPWTASVVAEAEGKGGNFYTVFRDGDAVTLRYHRLCEFVISPARDFVEWHLHPGVAEELVTIMASGTLMATLLILRHALVLHASAVEIGDAAVVFVGMSGMGKSTLASLVALARGALISDDVLRVEFDTDPICFAGATETRLRSSSASLAVQGAKSRTTADERLALTLPAPSADRVRIRAVIVPYVDKEARPVFVEPVPPARAPVLLSRFPRVQGWTEPATARTQFEQLMTLISRVPVWRCRVPWGPPFSPSLADDILTAIGWDDAGAGAGSAV